MKIQCPECGVSGTLDDAHAGKKIRCPKCKSQFIASDTAPPVPPLPAEGEPLTPPVEPGREKSEDTVVKEIGDPPPPIHQQVEGEQARKNDGGDGTSGERDSKPFGPAPGAKGAESEIRSMRIGDLLSRAWELTLGVKGPIWGGMAAMYGILFLSGGLFAILMESGAVTPDGLTSVLFDLVSSAISTLFTAGMMYMGVKRATMRDVVWKDIFSGFAMTGQVIIAFLLQTILILIGIGLLILPGIYLAIGYGMTFALILDKGMSPWEAMETSRKAIHKVWWKMFGLYLVVTLIIMVSAIPFGIGLIWTLPMSVVLYGVVYVALFGSDG